MKIVICYPLLPFLTVIEYFGADRLKTIFDSEDYYATALIGQFDLPEKSVLFLDACIYGGGNPAKTFMYMFSRKRGKTKISELLYQLKKDDARESFTSAIEFLESCEVSTVGNLRFNQLESLADKVRVLSGVPFKDWKYIAQKFDMGDDIPAIKQTIRQGNCYSSYEGALRILKQVRSNTTLEDFLNVYNSAKENNLHSPYQGIIDAINNLILEEAEDNLGRKP